MATSDLTATSAAISAHSQEHSIQTDSTQPNTTAQAKAMDLTAETTTR